MSSKNYSAWIEYGLPSFQAESYLKEYVDADAETQEEMRKTETYAMAHKTVFYIFHCPMQRRVFFNGIVDKISGEEHEPCFSGDVGGVVK